MADASVRSQFDYLNRCQGATDASRGSAAASQRILFVVALFREAVV